MAFGTTLTDAQNGLNAEQAANAARLMQSLQALHQQRQFDATLGQQRDSEAANRAMQLMQLRQQGSQFDSTQRIDQSKLDQAQKQFDAKLRAESDALSQQHKAALDQIKATADARAGTVDPKDAYDFNQWNTDAQSIAPLANQKLSVAQAVRDKAIADAKALPNSWFSRDSTDAKTRQDLIDSANRAFAETISSIPSQFKGHETKVKLSADGSHFEPNFLTAPGGRSVPVTNTAPVVPVNPVVAALSVPPVSAPPAWQGPPALPPAAAAVRMIPTGVPAPTAVPVMQPWMYRPQVVTAPQSSPLVFNTQEDLAAAVNAGRVPNGSVVIFQGKPQRVNIQ